MPLRFCHSASQAVAVVPLSANLSIQIVQICRLRRYILRRGARLRYLLHSYFPMFPGRLRMG